MRRGAKAGSRWTLLFDPRDSTGDRDDWSGVPGTEGLKHKDRDLPLQPPAIAPVQMRTVPTRSGRSQRFQVALTDRDYVEQVARLTTPVSPRTTAGGSGTPRAGHHCLSTFKRSGIRCSGTVS